MGITGLTALVIIISGILLWNKPKETIAAWWNDNWSYRKAIVINHNYVEADLVNFPVLISLTDANLGSHAQEDGDDIIFISQNGRRLSHEIEAFATSTGNLVAWVKVESLSSADDTLIYMYYGNAGVGNQQEPSQVWDENYMGVWHMPDDETASGTDSTKYNNDGNVKNGASTTATAQIDGGMQFNGSSDYIDCGDDNSVLPDAFSLAVWIKYDCSDGSMPIAGWNGQPSIRITTTDSRPLIYFGNNNYRSFSSSSPVNLCDNNWHHIVFILPGSAQSDINNSKMYADGQEQNIESTLAGGPQVSKINFYIGKSGGLYFTGFLDEVRISNSIRSAAWIETSYNNQNSPATFFSEQAEETGPGPVGYWSFDEGHGTTAHDESGEGNNGTITGAEWQDDSQCVSGKCLTFDNTGEKVNCGNISLNTTAVTVSWWMNIKDYSGLSTSDGLAPIIIDWMKGGAANYQDGTLLCYIKTNPTWSGGNYATNGLICTYSSGDSQLNDLGSNISVELNKWYFVSYTVDGTSANLYINGNLENSMTGAGNISPESEVFTINNRDWNYGTSSDAVIDEVKIYPYARTADEIRQDYAAGLAGIKTAHGVAAAFGGTSEKWLTDGLVGYWQMDESATTSGAFDASGNGNNGTYYGDASTTAGRFGNGGSFDGSGDWVDCGDTNNISGAITLAAWIKVDNFDIIHQAIITKGDYTYRLARYSSSNNIAFALGEFAVDMSQIISTVNVNDGKWHHIVGTFTGGNGGMQKLYINGIEDGSLIRNYDNWDNENDSLMIGQNDGWVRDWEGQLDEVRIYNRALSAREVRKLYEWAPGPIAHWKFDEKTGTTAYDSAASTTYSGGNHGALTCDGGGCDIPTWARGKYGSALEFDGSDDYVDIDVDPSNVLGGAFTFTAWVKIEGGCKSDNCAFIDHLPGDGYGEFLYYDQYGMQDLYFRTVDSEGGAVAIQRDYPMNLNQWYFVTVVYDLSDAYFYANGVQVGASQNFGALEYGSNDWIIGAEGNGGSANFNGLIDDVRIYNYARTQKQILEDMNARRRQGSGGQAGPSQSTVLHLKFDEGYGATAYDSSPHKNNGTLDAGGGGSNFTESAMWSLDGKFGRAMEFDGVDDYVSVVANDSIADTFDNGGTVSAWIYLNSFGTNGMAYIISKYNASVNDWIFWVEDTGGSTNNTLKFSNDFSSVAGYWEARDEIFINNWYHVAVVYDNASVTNDAVLYINGERTTIDYSEPGSGVDGSDSAINLTIGERSTDALRNFDGLIDEVKIYNYALDDDEIKTLYNQGQAAVMGSISTATSTNAQGQTVHVPSNAASQKYCVPGSTDYCAPPVLELKMDEKQGTTTYDTSGQGNDGVFVNQSTSPNWNLIGKKGSCLEFDGGDDYVAVPYDSTLNITDDITIVIWIKRAGGIGNYQSMVAKTNESVWNYDLLFEEGNNDLQFYSGDTSPTYVEASGTISDINSWHHIAVTRNSSTVNFYIDGSASGGGTMSGSFGSNTYQVNIGNDAAHFNGLIDDVKIYNYARTPAQIAWDYNRGKPIAYWRFDECSGGTIYDQSRRCKDSGDCNNGTLHLGTSGTTATGTCASSSNSFWYNGRNGKINSAGSFDGTDDWVVVPDPGANSIFDITDEITISAWVKKVSNTGWDAIVTKADSGANIVNYSLSGYGDEIDFSYYSSGTWQTMQTTSANLQTGTWYHILVTYSDSANSIDIYVNMVLQPEKVIYGNPENSSMIANNEDVHIGNSKAHDSPNDGLIDEVKIWNYALTAEQIKMEYSGGAVRFGK